MMSLSPVEHPIRHLMLDSLVQVDFHVSLQLLKTGLVLPTTKKKGSTVKF